MSFETNQTRRRASVNKWIVSHSLPTSELKPSSTTTCHHPFLSPLSPFLTFTNQFTFRNGNHLVYINCSSNEVGLLVMRVLGYLIILKHRNNQSCRAAQAGGGNHNLYFNLIIFQPRWSLWAFLLRVLI